MISARSHPDAVLLKPGKLDEGEYWLMRQHRSGDDILQNCRSIRIASALSAITTSDTMAEGTRMASRVRDSVRRAYRVGGRLVRRDDFRPSVCSRPHYQ
jgi:hypothetical protein